MCVISGRCEAVCALVVCSLRLIPITAMLTYRLWVFVLRNCLHGWQVATSRVCMGVVFGAVCTCGGYVLHHYTAYHYTAIASITSLSSTVTLPSAPLLSVTSRAAVEYSAQHVAGCKGMIIIPGMYPHREEEGVCKSGTVRSLQITKLECSKGTGSLTCLSE